MRAGLEEALASLRAELSADLIVVRQQVGARVDGVVLLTSPPGALPAGTAWPMSEGGLASERLERDPVKLAGLVPSSIRLALEHPPRAALARPVPETSSRVLALWNQAPSAGLDDGPSEHTLRALSTPLAAWERQERALLDVRRYETALETLEDAVVTLDLVRERASVNASGARLLGVAAGELPAPAVTHALQCLQERALNRDEVRAVMLRLLTDPAAVIKDAVWSFPSAPTFLRVSSAPLTGPGLTGRSWVFSDVSRLVEAINEAERLERIKGEFVATVSHELRTPLTSIRGALGLIAGGVTGELPALAREHVGLALKNAERLIRLVNELLDLERIQTGSLKLLAQRTPVAALVAHAVEVNRGYATTLQVKLALQEPLPDVHVLADPDRLEQVLANLLSNAAKFAPPTRPVEISAVVRGGRVIISVRDHGPGVPAEFKDRLFERFAQADGSDSRRRGGTGLGLSISRGLVERMGGTLGYEAPADGGARFFVELPLSG